VVVEASAGQLEDELRLASRTPESRRRSSNRCAASAAMLPSTEEIVDRVLKVPRARKREMEVAS
jgi:hypothetical protein